MAEERETPDGIDPRFDPTFQRGFRPDSRRSDSSRRERSRREPVARSAPDRAAHESTLPPKQAQAPAQAPKQVPIPPVSPPNAADSAAGSTIDEDDGTDLVSMTPPARFNPYIVALWVIGIILVVAGAGFLFWAQTISRMSGGYDPNQGVPIEIILANLAYSVSGPMVAVGLATLIGLIFLRAVGHRSVR